MISINMQQRPFKRGLMVVLITALILLIGTGTGVCIETCKYKNTSYTYTFEINDTVFIENKEIYIDCKPHTIYKDSFVYFNFSMKKYKGNVDCYLGFNDISKPINVSIFDGKKWVEIKQDFKKCDLNYDKKDNWHYIKNVFVNDNSTVQIKMWLELQKNVKDGKFNFGIKPSDISLTDSINKNKFYVLDPFYHTWFTDTCPCNGAIPCNKSMFIDIDNKKFLYLQTHYYCGNVDGSDDVMPNIRDVGALMSGNVNCNPPMINYEILNYNNYVGTNIIRPNRCIYDD